MSKVLPFRWYGGKYSHLDWLLPLLPETEHYIEPFGGSAAVLLNRKPSPLETYNDIDEDVTTFFKVLRDNRREFLEKLVYTPFSRKEFEEAIEKKDKDDLSEMEQARLFFVRAGQVRSGLAQEATPGRWAWCKKTSRRNMSGAVSRWWGRLDNLDKIADRLAAVQIENRPAIEVIERYDYEGALFYCDPPYPHEARGDINSYRFEMNDEEHRELSEVLHDCEGKVAVSSYQCNIMEELYGDWNRVDAPEKTMHTTKDKRQESLWINYEPPERNEEENKK